MTSREQCSRGEDKVAVEVFQELDILNGLVPDSVDVIARHLGGRLCPKAQTLTSLVLHDGTFAPTDNWPAGHI